MAFEAKDTTGERLSGDVFAAPGFVPPRFRAETRERQLPSGLLKSTQWTFDGISITHVRSELTAPLTLQLHDDNDVITMLFNLRGKITTAPLTQEISASQHNLFYEPENWGRVHAEAQSLELFLVQLPKNKFMELTRECPDELQLFNEQLKAGTRTVLAAKPLNTDLHLHSAIHAMLQCTLADALKRIYFYAKLLELLVLQTESYNRSKQQKSVYLKKEYDRERILFARDYLLKNMERPPALTELAHITGINVFKLKRGFKETFGLTVFEYLAETRLELAKNDLRDTDKSITEIAFELGYSSLQHFSNAFKKKFGVSPGKAKL